jgi:hypothetical protein
MWCAQRAVYRMDSPTGYDRRVANQQAGYSGTPLPKKLEIKPNVRVALVGAPSDFERLLVPLPDGATLVRGLSRPRDLTIWFITSRRQLEGDLRRVLPKTEGSFWIAWPKKTSGMVTDLSENLLRDVVLPTGFVDRKVCAIDATWSGLLFSRRRPK